jgi:glycine/D-amino acid oxidase-like deaminating enzyme
MALKSKASSRYQTLVIGGGICGLMIAHRLSHLGESVALVEELDQLGGEDRPHLSTFGLIDHGLKVLPATSDGERALEFLKTALPQLTWQTEDVPPLTFDSGQFKPFVGFGAKVLEAHEVVTSYAHARRLLPSVPVHEWVELLQRDFRGDVYLKSFVTLIDQDNDVVSGVHINGKEQLLADRIIFCGQPKDLLKYAIASNLPARLRQRIGKAELWTSIGLELFHSQPVTDRKSVHVLWSPSDDGSPCVGSFQTPKSNQDITYQHSQWVTFVPFDATDDSELTGAAIRKIKKQVKRAFPDAFEKLHGEIIFVGPGSHGLVELKADEGLPLAPFDNLYLASSHVVGENPLVGALLQAEALLQRWPQPEEVENRPSPTLATIDGDDARLTQ